MPVPSLRGRFAPSPTGPAHPGTLLAGLLAWLDMRHRGGSILLRLEDLDPQRCREQWTRELVDDLHWLGLDWDEVIQQSNRAAAHAAALDALAAQGLLYACRCTRSTLRAYGRRAPDGGYAYPNRCRGHRVDAASWRRTELPLRVQLPAGMVHPLDVGGRDLSQDPGLVMGDPVVRRRDGAVAYQLAVVVDDADAAISHVVRGHDIAPSTATQVALLRLLNRPVPTYRHHMLLCEERGHKLAKLHGAVGAGVLRQHYAAAQLCGFLAHAAGLRPDERPVTPHALLDDFNWDHVGTVDRVVHWNGARLRLAQAQD